MQEHGRLEAELARVRAAATKETQIARQVEMNLEIMRLREQLAAVKAIL